MKEYQAKPYILDKFKLGEGPYYDPRTGRLSWVDIIDKKIHILANSGKRDVVELGQLVGAAIPLSDSEGFVAMLEDGLYVVEDGEKRLLFGCSMYEPYQRSNDAKVDFKGRIYFGATSELDRHPKMCGNLFCYDKGEVNVAVQDTVLSNGMAWSKEHKRFYFSDSGAHAVFAYDYDEMTGSLSNKEILVSYQNKDMSEIPDGLCIDDEDNLWIAIWGGSRVECRSGKDGELLAKIDVDAKRVTCCCFGGASNKTLYITSSGDGLAGEHDGNVFICELDVTGPKPDFAVIDRSLLEENRYKKNLLEAKAHFDGIAKPLDGLGLLEQLIEKLCAIEKTSNAYDISKRAVVSFCADHGVVCEGVTQTDKSVTQIVAENFVKDSSSVNHMSRIAGADVFAVDIGMDTEEYSNIDIVTGKMIHRKVARGTKNLAKEAAMTELQCRRAMDVGLEMAKELKAKGYKILAAGEMGIGNTTPTAVLGAYLLDLEAKDVTGRGAGLDDAGLERKRQVVASALRRVKEMENLTPIKLLAEVGGLEIAGMVGLFLGTVQYEIPVVMDGAISVVSALVANSINPRVKDYVLASHMPEEIVGRLALRALGQSAILHGRFCLGEGTGAVALFPLLDMGMEVYRRMASFEDLQIDAYERSGKPDGK